MYYFVFGLVSIISAGVLFGLLVGITGWHPYLIWLVAWTPVGFLVYGLDKSLSKVGRVRVPELILHLVALAGGVLGAWLGRAVFRHKSNVRRHPAFLVVLVLATVLHGALVYVWLIRGGL
ncbi:MAG: DUF1294 domain-containing protein [Anaerolineae bacterium]|jgi:uncharacterized membrane protein YsdA (DUF1294 family)